MGGAPSRMWRHAGAGQVCSLCPRAQHVCPSQAGNQVGSLRAGCAPQHASPLMRLLGRRPTRCACPSCSRRTREGAGAARTRTTARPASGGTHAAARRPCCPRMCWERGPQCASGPSPGCACVHRGAAGSPVTLCQRLQGPLARTRKLMPDRLCRVGSAASSVGPSSRRPSVTELPPQQEQVQQLRSASTSYCSAPHADGGVADAATQAMVGTPGALKGADQGACHELCAAPVLPARAGGVLQSLVGVHRGCMGPTTSRLAAAVRCAGCAGRVGAAGAGAERAHAAEPGWQPAARAVLRAARSR